jgi:hypothetical protein
LRVNSPATSNWQPATSNSTINMIPPTITPAPRRVRRKRRSSPTAAAPPGPPNEITDWSDPFSGPDNTLTVTVQGTVTAIDVGGFEGHQSSDGWFPITSVDLSDPPRVRFVFGRDMTGSDAWRVPDASKWHFADGQPLVGPTSGDFT